MTRGNQRDLARQKNMKKQQEMNKGKNDDGLTPAQRRERDAKALAEKVKKKEEKQGEQSSNKK